MRYVMQAGCELWDQPGYLCTVAAAEACSYDLMSKSYCDLQTYSHPLPPQLQRFDEPTLGGYSELLDYCPVYRPYRNGHCTAAPSGAAAAEGEEFCETCRCVARRTGTVGTGTGGGTGTGTVNGGEGEGEGEGAGPLRPECHKTRCLNSSSLEARRITSCIT